MSDETKTVEETETSKIPQDKTFTQAEVDRLISQRLEREKSKFSDYDTLKDQVDALTKEKQEREEAELSEIDKLKKQLEEKNSTIEELNVDKEWRKRWIEGEEESIIKLMEESELTDVQVEIVNALPLEKRKTAILELKASSEKAPPDSSKGITRGKKYSQDDLFKLKNQFGPGSPEYLNALKEYYN